MSERNHSTERTPSLRHRYHRTIFRAVRPVLGMAVSLLLLHVFRADIAIAQQSSAGEYELKAAMLYNLARFVEWPASAYADAQAPTIVCLLGRDPFGSFLTSLAAKQTVNGRPLQIRRVRNNADLNGCHILYISSSERKNIGPILAGLRGSSVLTVGEMAQFATRGGMVQFELEDKQVHFNINLDASLRADLKISARLLVLAKIVKGQDSDNSRPAGLNQGPHLVLSHFV